LIDIEVGTSSIADHSGRASYLKNVHTTIVIALYNIGVEYEHLAEFSTSLDFFKRAMTHNKDHLVGEPNMARVIIEGLASVQQKHQKKMSIINAYIGNSGGMNGNGSSSFYRSQVSSHN
jgi:hypothetical protein